MKPKKKSSLHSRIKIINLVWLSKQTLAVVAALAHLIETHCLATVVQATWRSIKIGWLLARMNAGDNAHISSIVYLSLTIINETL